MTRLRLNHIHLLLLLLGPILFPACVLAGAASEPAVLLHLKTGDQISGFIVSENTNQVVLSNAWVKTLSIPLSAIASRETNVTVAASLPALPTAGKPAARAKMIAALQPSLKAPVKSIGTWHGQINVGTSIILSAIEQQAYSGNASFVYTLPYVGNPKQFFKNITDLGGLYQRTDGQTSANNAHISNKSDFDMWYRYYAYGQVGAGYDRIQNIDFQYQVGPGVGMHLLQYPHFALNTEAGLAYQEQYNRNAPNLQTVYARLAEDFTWEIWKNLKLTENEAFYPDLEHGGEYHNDFASTFSFGFWKHLTLNLTVNDHYNTQLSAGANPNEFDFVSSVGYTF